MAAVFVLAALDHETTPTDRLLQQYAMDLHLMRDELNAIDLQCHCDSYGFASHPLGSQDRPGELAEQLLDVEGRRLVGDVVTQWNPAGLSTGPHTVDLC